MTNLLIITENESDLLHLLREKSSALRVIRPNELNKMAVEAYDAIALLGGGQEKPMLFAPPERKKLEAHLASGKKIFAEFVQSIGHVYCEEPVSTRFERVVYCSGQEDIPSLSVGSLIDPQSGWKIRPHDIACHTGRPILQYIEENVHDFLEVTEKTWSDVSNRAMWFEEPNNLLVCGFQLSMFRRARYAPWDSAKQVIRFVVEWLLDKTICLDSLQPIYQMSPLKHDLLQDQLDETISKAMKWFDEANMIIDDGIGGAYEGMATEIDMHGRQRKSEILRADCMGEISLTYYLDYLQTGKEASLSRSNHLMNYIFDHYVVKDHGPLHGMMRWTNEAWGVCYQDDVARAIIPQLLKCYFEDSREHLDTCVDILQFLVRTTGKDGTRVFRTDNMDLSEAMLTQLREEAGNFPSAHYNAYYHASLLLAYRLTGIRKFKEVAITGLRTIMEAYPETTREQSETQEYCRLILPLSWLYWVTGESEHKQWLYQVTEDLQRFKHSSGCYIEWDTGYTATMRNEKGEEESSLLTKNGDPIADLLYSNNWLPMAFMQAYFITDDHLFYDLWQENVRFFAKTQITSDNEQINGVWARAYEVDKQEVYGTPADKGWGPWAIESGWTVAEITSGMLMGRLYEQLRGYYDIKSERH